MDKTKIRYVVKYKDRTYEHPLHSNKRYFIRNVADVVNVLEYCVSQDLKNALYDNSNLGYTFNVDRLVNDVPDKNFDNDKFNNSVSSILEQSIYDNIKRNKA